MNRYYLLLFFFAALASASCVTKKKYLQLDAQLQEQRQVAQDYRLKMDTLEKQNFALRDSLNVSDSLLALERGRADHKGLPKPGGPPKKNALSKDEEYEKKAIYIFNFTKQVDWPATMKGDKFVIGVLGSSPLYDKLKKTAGDKRAAGKPIEIKTFSVSNLQPCQVLYVTHAQIGEMAKVRALLKNSATLIITEEGYWSGGSSHVNFYVDDTRLRYQLNKPAAEKAGLKITQEMIKFAE